MSIIGSGYMYGIENAQKTGASDSERKMSIDSGVMEQSSVQSEPVVTWGKYTGGKLPGRKSGYQNFVSKQFALARQHLAIFHDCDPSEISSGDVWSHMSVVWRGLDVKTKEHWGAFAKGKADEPQMGISDWIEHRKSEVDTSVKDPSPSRFSALPDGGGLPRVKEYLKKHDLQRVLQDALNAAVKDRSSNPKLFIANYLCDSVPMFVAGHMKRTSDRGEKN